MRIIHTSDWHLGLKLGGYDRTDELFSQVDRICSLATENKADVLLVAGDVFVKGSPEITKRLADLLSPYVRRGLHVILVRGNHDKPDHFQMIRALLRMEQGEGERVHIAQTRQIIEIDGVQFAVVPYPTPELLEPHRASVVGTTERNVALSTAYANLVRAVAGALKPSLPAVFVAHVNVAGIITPSEKELTYDEDLRLGRQDLPLLSNLAYVALGHIHQCQQVDHPVPCWYSGSIDRMDMGERNDDKYVLVVDVAKTGPAMVTRFPVEATPFYDLSITSAELEAMEGKYPDLDRAFVRLKIECAADDEPVALQRRVREIFKRCLGVSLTGEWASLTRAGSPQSPGDFATTAIGYLHQVFKDDPALPALELRANKLLQEVHDANPAS
jgi:DNA repair protein SbcD/Mre11